MPSLLLPSPPLSNVAGRQGLSLDGQWVFVPDPESVLAISDLNNGTFDSSNKFSVPGDWNYQRPEWFHYEGPAWFSKVFSYDPVVGRRVFAYLAGADKSVEFWCNGHGPIGYVNGPGALWVEITDALSEGLNRIVIRGDNKQTSVRSSPGGLYRSVSIVDVAQTFIRDSWVQLEPNGCELVGELVVDGPEAANRTVTVRIPELGVGSRLITDSYGQAAVRIDGWPDVWSPEDPRLYRVEWELAGELLVDDVGFRVLSIVDGQILLNGELIKLKGVAIEDCAPKSSGRASGSADSASIVNWVRELGCNFIDLLAGQPDEALIRACDRGGVLVSCENDLGRKFDASDGWSYSDTVERLEELVVRDRSRASIISWNIARTPLSDDGDDVWMPGLLDTVRHLDPHRLLSANVSSATDELIPMLDFCRSVITTDTTTFPRLFVFEGTPALLGSRGAETILGTEESQTALLRSFLELESEFQSSVGVTIGILKDLASKRHLRPGLEDGYDRRGLLSEDGVPKDSYRWLSSYNDRH
jgi:beta-glucuronidase|tara:strand:- start:594 stop:2180 length:1587 start_codon:yes stop_codon:yes gene_type:complete